jgi:hypothetical protein
VEPVESARRQLAGLPGADVNETAMKAHVEQLVAKALVNAASPGEPVGLTNERTGKALKRLLGLNSGPDQVTEILITNGGGVDAFDRAGYHIFDATVSGMNDKKLYVQHLRASHGRNVADLGYGWGDRIPGRGNARVVSESLQGLVELAVESGYTSVGCTPGSDEVAKLYAKMGFKPNEGHPPGAYVSMTLDLTNPAAMRQAIFVFAASRANIVDVPKDVAAKIYAGGSVPNPPARDDVMERMRAMNGITYRLDSQGDAP